MSYSTYAEYLAHPKFRRSVALAARRANGSCEHCLLITETEPHHVRYCAWGDFDPPENLVMLCRACHEDAHRCASCARVRLKAKHIKERSVICDDCRGARKEGA
jgi:hypothetical protein